MDPAENDQDGLLAAGEVQLGGNGKPLPNQLSCYGLQQPSSGAGKVRAGVVGEFYITQALCPTAVEMP